MATFMKPYELQTYALMRIVAGFLFLWHGCQKLFGFPGTLPEGVPAFIIYVAGPLEFIGGILVMIGLFTHWAWYKSTASPRQWRRTRRALLLCLPFYCVARSGNMERGRSTRPLMNNSGRDKAAGRSRQSQGLPTFCAPVSKGEKWPSGGEKEERYVYC